MLLKPTKIRSYLAAMKVRGFSIKAVLAGTDLTEHQLQDPALLVEQHQRERVIHNMLRLSGNPALGLELGIASQAVDVGVLAYAQMSARSMREALALWIRYSGVAGTTIPIRLDEKSSNDWGVVYDIDNTAGPVAWFSAEELVGMAASFGPAIGGSAFMLRECSFSYAAPPHWERYALLLRCPVRFNARQTSMRPKSPDLDWTLPGSDPEFHLICLRYLKQVTRQIGHERPITSRLRTLLLSRPATPPSLDEAAEYLGMSARTLRRHLQQEGSRYQGLIDRVRLDLATEYLQGEHKSIKEVGYELGYRNVNAFRRAFKSWTGNTIQDYLARS